MENLETIYTRLETRKEGLRSEEALTRLKKYGPNVLPPAREGKGFILFLSQFKSPLILLLIGAAILSFLLGGNTDAIIISVIVILSGGLGFIQEWGAVNALEKLLSSIGNKTSVLRDSKEVNI